jgi:Skp family chaperone for outer membrane proteins
MKIRNTFFAAAFAALASVAASAQTQPASRPASPGVQQTRPPASAPSSGALAEGKFAIIDTEAFGDPKEGIQRLVAAFQTVEREFKPRRDEIQTLRTRYDALVKEVNDTKAVAAPAALQTKADQATQLETEIKRKQEDGQKALDRRVQELTGPVYQDIGNALQAYAKSRGLSAVFDVSKMQGVIMVVDGGLDITNAFITEYNQRNPASTAAATPATNR